MSVPITVPPKSCFLADVVILVTSLEANRRARAGRRAMDLLEIKGVPFRVVDLANREWLNSESQGVVKAAVDLINSARCGRDSRPQIFVNGVCVGSDQELQDLEDEGTLVGMLMRPNETVKRPPCLPRRSTWKSSQGRRPTKVSRLPCGMSEVAREPNVQLVASNVCASIPPAVQDGYDLAILRDELHDKFSECMSGVLAELETRLAQRNLLVDSGDGVISRESALESSLRAKAVNLEASLRDAEHRMRGMVRRSFWAESLSEQLSRQLDVPLRSRQCTGVELREPMIGERSELAGSSADVILRPPSNPSLTPRGQIQDVMTTVDTKLRVLRERFSRELKTSREVQAMLLQSAKAAEAKIAQLTSDLEAKQALVQRLSESARQFAEEAQEQAKNCSRLEAEAQRSLQCIASSDLHCASVTSELDSARRLLVRRSFWAEEMANGLVNAQEHLKQELKVSFERAKHAEDMLLASQQALAVCAADAVDTSKRLAASRKNSAESRRNLQTDILVHRFLMGVSNMVGLSSDVHLVGRFADRFSDPDLHTGTSFSFDGVDDLRQFLIEPEVCRTECAGQSGPSGRSRNVESRHGSDGATDSDRNLFGDLCRPLCCTGRETNKSLSSLHGFSDEDTAIPWSEPSDVEELGRVLKWRQPSYASDSSRWS